jgi:hypothetical protein
MRVALLAGHDLVATGGDLHVAHLVATGEADF